MIKLSAAQDLVLLARLPLTSDFQHARFSCLVTHNDGVQVRYNCVIFEDYEIGWAQAALVEKLEQHSPQSSRCKLRPIFFGPCIKSIVDSSNRSVEVAYYALYPVVGPPITALPESVFIDLTAQEICTAAHEYLLSMLSCDLSTPSQTIFCKDNTKPDDFIYDPRLKRIWLANFDNSIMLHQNWSGTSYLLANARHGMQIKNDGSEFSALIKAIRILMDFPRNSGKDSNSSDWRMLELFLSSNEVQSIQHCLEFFAAHGDSFEDSESLPPLSDIYYVPNASSAPAGSTATNGVHGVIFSNSQALAPLARISSPTSSESEPTSTSSTASTLSSNSKAYQPKYSKAPGANSPLPQAHIIASQASQALSENKSNPIVVVNDLYQRLTGVPPSLKDEGRLGGSDHVPRFGCSFTFPNGEIIRAEGSSKQEAKANVAIHILEAISKGTIPKTQR